MIWRVSFLAGEYFEVRTRKIQEKQAEVTNPTASGTWCQGPSISPDELITVVVHDMIHQRLDMPVTPLAGVEASPDFR